MLCIAKLKAVLIKSWLIYLFLREYPVHENTIAIWQTYLLLKFLGNYKKNIRDSSYHKINTIFPQISARQAYLILKLLDAALIPGRRLRLFRS